MAHGLVPPGVLMIQLLIDPVLKLNQQRGASLITELRASSPLN